MRLRRIAVAVVLVAAGAVSGLPAAAHADPPASCSEEVDVQLEADACGRAVAVSATGDAYSLRSCGGGAAGPLPDVTTCPVSGVAASGTGDAYTSASCSAAEVSCIAISGTGDATNDVRPDSRFGYAACGEGCIAISGTGQAENRGVGECSNGCVAIGGEGAANRDTSGFCGTNGVGCVAASPRGDASNDVWCGSSANTVAAAVNCLAISGTGDAGNSRSCSHFLIGYGPAPAAGIAVTCIAASASGDAENSSPEDACSTRTENAVMVVLGCVAVTGTGDARNGGEAACVGDDGSAGVRCVAIAPTGAAANPEGADSCRQEGTGPGVQCVALAPGEARE